MTQTAIALGQTTEVSSVSPLHEEDALWDDESRRTTAGGAVLAEQLLRRLGVGDADAKDFLKEAGASKRGADPVGHRVRRRQVVRPRD